MSGRLVITFISMMPKIQAEELLLAVQVGQVSSGLLEKAEQSRVLRRWQQVADVQAKPVQVNIHSLPDIGIAVVETNQ